MTHLIGITGGIASGKSTITAYLKQKGYDVIDADKVVHELQQKGGALYKTLVNWLGESILQADGQLNRALIGQKLFSDKDMMAKSARLQNPIIRQALSELADKAKLSDHVVFMDMPLLFEQDYDDWFDAIWLVHTDPDQQINRLIARNNYSVSEAHQRIASQLPFSEKKKRATNLIDNNHTIENTYRQVDALLANIT